MPDGERFLLVTTDDDPTLGLRIYSSLEALLGDIEPPEVLANAYTLFDELGREAEMAADDRRWEVTIAGWQTGRTEEMRRAVVWGIDDDSFRARVPELAPSQILKELEDRLGFRHLQAI